MSPSRRHPARLLLALLIGTAAVAARGQAPATGPAAARPSTQPVGDSATDPATELDDLWREPEDPSLLTSAAEVRALTPEQAAAGRAVRIRGTVTYLASVPPLMFLQDATGGVCVVGPRDREVRTQIRHGSVVQVEGVTARGADAAYVTTADEGPLRIEFLFPGRLSAPRLATVTQLGTPALHGELLEVEAVVRSIRSERLAATGPNATVLTLAQGESRAEALLLGRAGETIKPEEFVGAVVRARGVFNAATPERLEVVGRRLLLRSPRDLLVRTPAVAAGALPVTAIGTLGDLRTAPAQSRARVRGVVTLALAERGMFVQDSTGGVWVGAPSVAGGGEVARATVVQAGDAVDAAGFPGRRGWSTVLADATWTRTGPAPMPDAPLVTAEQALAAAVDARLVRIDALVLSVSRISQHTTFALQSGGRVFLARIADRTAGAPPAVSEGSWVRVTGVCIQTPLDEAWQGSGSAAAAGPDADVGRGPGEPPDLTPRPPSFYLLLASDKAVQVIKGPGWWTLRRVLVVCGILAAVALASIAWVVALRRRVARQTRMIREHLARRALYEERVRIARELHDSLEQDLLGITMQLNATDKLLGQPDRARQSLQLAAAMVRRSQAETHRAVWDLREQRLGPGGLVPAIEEAVAGLAAPRAANGSVDGPRVEVRGVGDPVDLPAQVENHLLRAALEAVTNAVKHAKASLIEVTVAFSPGRVEVTVRDDGRGFDPERLPPPSSGHFGLFGMRERAEKLGGELTLRSRPGAGSEIGLVVPTAGNGSVQGAGEPATAETVAT